MVLLVSASAAFADKADDAAKAYASGDAAKAVEIYEGLMASHGTSSALYYDLGQAYMKAGNLGKAMVSYQRALLLDPGNSQARANIEYLDSRVQDANRAEMKDKKGSVVPDDPSFFSSVKRFVTKRHTSNMWAWLAGSFFALFCGCVALYVFMHSVLWRKIGFFGGAATFSLSVIFLVFAFMAASAADDKSEGVVLNYKTQLHSEASSSSKNVGSPITQGTVMSILETVNGKDEKPEWYKVRLNSDYIGWIRYDDFEVI